MFENLKNKLIEMLDKNESFEVLDAFLEALAYNEALTSKEYCELVRIAQDSVKI